MTVTVYDVLPADTKRVVDALAEGMGHQRETVIAAILAWEQIKTLPKDERSKAIAVVVGLHGIKP